MDCNCPTPTSLTEIIASACGVNLKQIQRLAFQRIGSKFDSVSNGILTLAAWQAFMTASDNTKIVVTPLIGADPVIEAGEAIKNGGGDNSTMNGVEEIDGVNPAEFSCVFKSLPSETEKSMKALMCEGQSLVVYFILQGGKIAVKQITSDTVHQGFRIYAPFVSDRSNSGFGTKDTVTMDFSLEEGYSNDLVILTPEFNPLTEI